MLILKVSGFDDPSGWPPKESLSVNIPRARAYIAAIRQYKQIDHGASFVMEINVALVIRYPSQPDHGLEDAAAGRSGQCLWRGEGRAAG